MADGDTVKMKLTFWRGGKQPGDVIEVPADEAHRWTGFAELVEESKPRAGAPSDTAKVDDWRTYAISLGMSASAAETATKRDLQDYVKTAPPAQA
ncbi:hypothetical protein ACFYPN_16240 [Streptomyces sp. NPDC005576]|uniref:hypothetical protein n=1 Tax=Streptomyces sp. NPDC005576 TaxID=3364726 RepID=UPI00368A9FF3